MSKPSPVSSSPSLGPVQRHPQHLKRAATAGAVPSVMTIATKTFESNKRSHEGSSSGDSSRGSRASSILAQRVASPPLRTSSRSSNSQPSQSSDKGIFVWPNIPVHELANTGRDLAQDPSNPPGGQVIRFAAQFGDIRTQLFQGVMGADKIKPGDVIPWVDLHKMGLRNQGTFSTQTEIDFSTNTVIVFVPKIGIGNSDQLFDEYVALREEFKKHGIGDLVFIIKKDHHDAARFFADKRNPPVKIFPDPELEFTYKVGLSWDLSKEGYFGVPKPAAIIVDRGFVREIIEESRPNLRNSFNECSAGSVLDKVKAFKFTEQKKRGAHVLDD